MQRFLIILFSAICLISCQREGDLGHLDYEPFVVVEGSIEAGKYPSVLLTFSSSFGQDVDTAYVLKHVINHAIVTVSDGTDTEVLSFGKKPGLIPPFEYYGSKISGVPGKTYSLRIEVDGKVITGETTIPEPVDLDKIHFLKATPNDTIGYFHIQFKDNPQETRYYQVATRLVDKETAFTPCLFGTMSNVLFAGKEDISMQINKGPILYPKSSFDTFFVTGKEVEIRFSTISKAGYLFWNSWQEEVLNSQNPIFPAHTSLKSNIQGGIGIWCGYGSCNYRVIPE